MEEIFVLKMLCNKKIIPIFTVQQVIECKNCIHISAKKIWCCLFGIYIPSPKVKIEFINEIIIPDKKIKYPGMMKMAGNFTKESYKYIKEGRPKRSDEEIAKISLICQGCEEYVPQTKLGPRCKKCGCNMNIKARWATAHCPIGKW